MLAMLERRSDEFVHVNVKFFRDLQDLLLQNLPVKQIATIVQTWTNFYLSKDDIYQIAKLIKKGYFSKFSAEAICHLVEITKLRWGEELGESSEITIQYFMIYYCDFISMRYNEQDSFRAIAAAICKLRPFFAAHGIPYHLKFIIEELTKKSDNKNMIKELLNFCDEQKIYLSGELPSVDFFNLVKRFSTDLEFQKFLVERALSYYPLSPYVVKKLIKEVKFVYVDDKDSFMVSLIQKYGIRLPQKVEDFPQYLNNVLYFDLCPFNRGYGNFFPKTLSLLFSKMEDPASAFLKFLKKNNYRNHHSNKKNTPSLVKILSALNITDEKFSETVLESNTLDKDGNHITYEQSLLKSLPPWGYFFQDHSPLKDYKEFHRSSDRYLFRNYRYQHTVFSMFFDARREENRKQFWFTFWFSFLGLLLPIIGHIIIWNLLYIRNLLECVEIRVNKDRFLAYKKITESDLQQREETKEVFRGFNETVSGGEPSYKWKDSPEKKDSSDVLVSLRKIIRNNEDADAEGPATLSLLFFSKAQARRCLAKLKAFDRDNSLETSALIKVL